MKGAAIIPVTVAMTVSSIPTDALGQTFDASGDNDLDETKSCDTTSFSTVDTEYNNDEVKNVVENNIVLGNSSYQLVSKGQTLVEDNGNYYFVEDGILKYCDLQKIKQIKIDMEKSYGVDDILESDYATEYNSICEKERYTIILNENCENLNKFNDTLVFTIEGQVYVYNINSGEMLKIDSLSNYYIDSMYIINGEVIGFLSGGNVYKYDIANQQINDMGVTGVSTFIPTELGNIYVYNNSNGSKTVYADNKYITDSIDENSNCYVEDGYFIFTINNEFYQISIYDLFNNYSENQIEDLNIFEEEVFSEDYDIDNMGYMSNISYDINGLDNADYQITSVAIEHLSGIDGTKAGHTSSVSVNNTSLTDEQKRIVQKADDMYNFYWTPLKNMTTWYTDYERQSIVAGSPIYGVPYGQAGTNIGYDVSFEQYKKNVKDINSGAYKQHTYSGKTFPLQSADCSGFVSYCWGLPEKCGTSTIGKYVNVIRTGGTEGGGITEAAFKNLAVGDAFNRSNDHIVLVTGIDYVSQKVEITEQAPQGTYRAYYNRSALNKLMIDKGYSWYRYKNISVSTAGGTVIKPSTPSTGGSGSSSGSTSSYAKNTVGYFQQWLNDKYSLGLSVDGQFGTNTNKAAIKAWQTEANKKGAGLSVDGGFGTGSMNAASSCNIVVSSSSLSNSNFTAILQGMLTSRGYACDIDGMFGNNTETALKNFQKAKGIEADGKCGPATWYTLFNNVAPSTSSGSGSSSGSTSSTYNNSKFVNILQGMLTAKGYPCDIDGMFGENSKTALQKFQKSKNLDADGVCGPDTWYAIFN